MTKRHPSTAPAPEIDAPPARLTGRDAVRLHLTLTAGLALCVAAFTFEILRALSGNELSWLYVFEWPLFGGFGIYMWWNLLNEPLRARVADKASERTPGMSSAANPEHDEELEAWQNYVRKVQEADANKAEKAS